MLGICKNGHMTGQRHCALCGAARVAWAPGAGKVVKPAHARVTGTLEDPVRRLRRETRVQGRPEGYGYHADTGLPPIAPFGLGVF